MTDPQTTALAVLCYACRFYGVDPDRQCSRWRYGYGDTQLASERDIIVEDDEGWGASMGPKFGCVLGELKE